MFLQHGLELVANGDDEALDHEELGVDGEQEEHEEEEHGPYGSSRQPRHRLGVHHVGKRELCNTNIRVSS